MLGAAGEPGASASETVYLGENDVGRVFLSVLSIMFSFCAQSQLVICWPLERIWQRVTEVRENQLGAAASPAGVATWCSPTTIAMHSMGCIVLAEDNSTKAKANNEASQVDQCATSQYTSRAQSNSLVCLSSSLDTVFNEASTMRLHHRSRRSNVLSPSLTHIKVELRLILTGTTGR